MTNAVRYADTDDPAAKQISSDSTIEVAVEVPAWLPLPPGVRFASSGLGLRRAAGRALIGRRLS